MTYLLVKALHILAVVLWLGTALFIAALLPRISDLHGESRQRWLATLRKIAKRLETPAMILTWVLGIALMLWGGWASAAWMHAKLTLVLVLTGLHGIQAGRFKKLAKDPEHELPAWFGWLFPVMLLMLTAVIVLVAVKPF
ncbi:MAG TPA: CopD family protein [Pseudomonadales bacterium]|nr:CopD family protein [Pseudomonadales bacterium]